MALSQPKISNHITALEERLGVKLCQRGRRGFLLTDKGQIVHDVAKSLMATLDEQSGHLTALKGSLIRRLSIAVVDCSATDDNLKLSQAISSMAQMAPSVRISVEVKQPQDILSGIAGGAYEVGVGSFDNKINGLKYEDLYDEKHSLYCGASRPATELSKADQTLDRLLEYPWVHRCYWNRQRLKQIRPNELDRVVQ